MDYRPPRSPRFQFTIRSLLILTAAVAVYLAIGSTLGSISAWVRLTATIAAITLALLAYALVVATMVPLFLPESLRTGPYGLVSITVVVVLSLLGLVRLLLLFAAL